MNTGTAKESLSSTLFGCVAFTDVVLLIFNYFFLRQSAGSTAKSASAAKPALQPLEPPFAAGSVALLTVRTAGSRIVPAVLSRS